MPDPTSIEPWRGTPVLSRDRAIAAQLDDVHFWEFTRRHPYYVRYWQLANEWLEKRASGEFGALHVLRKARLEGATQLLNWILGVVAESYPDPAIDARTDPGFQVPFKRQCVSSLPSRELAFHLLAFLPEEAQRAISRVYLREIAGETASDNGLALLHAIAETTLKQPPRELELAVMALRGDGLLQDRLLVVLLGLDLPELSEQTPGIALFDFSAPMDRLIDDFRQVVGEQKKKFRVAETRRRPDKWGHYLDVWDRREGWTGGKYDGTTEQRLRDIGLALGIPLVTVQSHHKAAFRLITGHDYCPSLWAALFGTVKLGELKSKRASWRRGKARTELPANNAAEHETREIESAPPADMNAELPYQQLLASDSDYAELLGDISKLLKMGRTDEEIVMELDLQGTKLVSYLRARSEDALM